MEDIEFRSNVGHLPQQELLQPLGWPAQPPECGADSRVRRSGRATSQFTIMRLTQRGPMRDRRRRSRSRRINGLSDKEKELLFKRRKNPGHYHNRVLSKMLKAQGVEKNLVKGALKPKCHGCDMVKGPKASGMGSGFKATTTLQCILIDGFDWRVPRDMSKVHIMTLVVDEGSGLTMTFDHGVIGPEQSSSRTWEIIKESWTAGAMSTRSRRRCGWTLTGVTGHKQRKNGAISSK